PAALWEETASTRPAGVRCDWASWGSSGGTARDASMPRVRAVGVIPARHAASRFPGKPLAPIAGVPMVQRVYEGAARAKRLSRVIVATDDARVADACAAFAAEVGRTSPSHAAGADRIAEVAARRSPATLTTAP